MRALAFLAGVLAFAVIMDAPAKIYKWVDDEGQVHYGQQPPNGVDARPMSVHTAPASPGGGAASNAAGGGSGDGQSGDGNGNGQQSASNDQSVEENCKVAKKNLNVLETAGPGGRFRQPDGEVVRYDEEQWQTRVDRNRKYIEVFCQDGEE